MNKYNKLVETIKEKKVISVEELAVLYGEVDQSYLYYILKKLQDDNIIKKIAINQYGVLSGKRKYSYDMTEKGKRIAECVLQKFPLIETRIYETSIFNEFVNHQITQNVIFVEVERGTEYAVYEKLNEEFGYSLLKPKIDDFRLYGQNGTIIIKNLISESPKDEEKSYLLTLEKMLVDLYVDNILGIFVNKNEYRILAERCFLNYIINERKLLRYASRRNARKEMQSIIDSIQGRITND